MFHKTLFYILCLLLTHGAYAASKNIDLTVEYKDVNFTGIISKAIAVNGQVPGPVLRIQQGDDVVVNVQNNLDVGTSIHWHGILVPWQMDGVAGVSQQEIAPGDKFKYEFPVEQAGTYWYHAHTGLEEQQGLYGALIIDPKIKPKYKYDKDIVIVLSDWSNTPAETIMANLQKNGMYYSARYNLRELNDVAYDAFLLNGYSKNKPWTQQVKAGDVVRLRFICAAAMTIFRVKAPPHNLQTVNIQGNDVEPYNGAEFIIAPGETHDVLLKISEEKPCVIYAESLDKIGHVYGLLTTPANEVINDAEIKKLAFTNNFNLEHKYKHIIAADKTNDPNIPIFKTINMRLNGNMTKYIWSIDNKTGYIATPIMLQPNRRYRIIITNESKMPHPMHIHGHWFILRKGERARDPLLHTVLVAPESSVTLDVDTDASGQWIFHCHMLYHMQAGMFRIFQYTTLPEILAGKIQPQDIIKRTEYINRPIIRVDEIRPIDAVLVEHPEPK